MSTPPDAQQLLGETDVEGAWRQQSQSSASWRLKLTAGLVAAGSVCVWVHHRTAASVPPPPPHSFEFQELISAAEKKDDATCSAAGQSCLDTKCCSSDGMQCYAKDANWAECRYECTPGRDPTSLDEGVWTCGKLGERTPGEAPECSAPGEDCTKTGCCADAGMQCFEKIKGAWATCKPSCTAGLDLRDADSNPWTCKPLGPPTPNVAQWVYEVCAGPHTSCAESGCCSTPGMQCFLHDEFYGECMGECNTEGWDCGTKGYRTPIPAPPEDSNQQGPVADWVATKCAKEGENCKSTSCCAAEGTQCFEKNSSFGGCRATCDAGPNLYDEDNKPWSCEVLGPKTPGLSLQPWELRKNLSDWVNKTCGGEYSDDCTKSRCCKKVGDRCFEKNEEWGTCMPQCEPGAHKGDDDGGKWTCKALGPETHRAYPSLFCFHVLRSTGTEPGLVGASMGSGAGIWECDKYALFSADAFTVGEGDWATDTVQFEAAEVVTSKDGTAGNAKLFMNVWDAVKTQGMYKEADWTIKVDPDAVLIPFRLRQHLDVFHGRKGYVVNCAKPYMPEGPMMFGALEAISSLALDMYLWKAEDCKTGLDWAEWGEDLFMGKCLEMIGVERLDDWQIYSDGVCRGVDCGDPVAAAFHPMKDEDSWRGCLEQTRNPHGASGNMDENQPQWFKDYMSQYR